METQDKERCMQILTKPGFTEETVMEEDSGSFLCKAYPAITCRNESCSIIELLELCIHLSNTTHTLLLLLELVLQGNPYSLMLL